MAKKTRPSFSGAAPASATPETTERDTAWVYRTDGEATADGETAAGEAPRHAPARRAAAAKRTKRAASDGSAHQDEANEIVRKYMTRGVIASAIPVPFADMAALGAVHVMMVRALAAEYGVPFDQGRARAVVAAVAGGAVSRFIGNGIGRAALKALPGGAVLAGLALPAATGATTYALGQIVIAHFEAGGGLHDLDAKAAAKHARAADGAAA